MSRFQGRSIHLEGSSTHTCPDVAVILFIYAFVTSTCLKVRNATILNVKEGVTDKEHLERFKGQLLHAEQSWPLATIHIWIAYTGLAVTFVIHILTGGFLASICFW